MSMTSKELQEAGMLLYGSQWQTDLANSLKTSARTVRRWSKGESPIPSGICKEINQLLSQQNFNNKAFMQKIGVKKTNLQIVLFDVKKIYEENGGDFDELFDFYKSMTGIKRIKNKNMLVDDWILFSDEEEVRFRESKKETSPLTCHVEFKHSRNVKVVSNCFSMLVFPAIYGDYMEQEMSKGKGYRQIVNECYGTFSELID